MEGHRYPDEREADSAFACFIRATAYDRWCENPASDEISIISTFAPTGTSQATVGSSCVAPWILYDTSCYWHNQVRLSFADANNLCASMDASLASIHSNEENSFISYMTGGVASWIGIVDVNRASTSPADHRWTDNSPMDYRNWDGNESKTDPAAQWYNRNSNELAPSVCKKPASSALSSITIHHPVPGPPLAESVPNHTVAQDDEPCSSKSKDELKVHVPTKSAAF